MIPCVSTPKPKVLSRIFQPIPNALLQSGHAEVYDSARFIDELDEHPLVQTGYLDLSSVNRLSIARPSLRGPPMLG